MLPSTHDTPSIGVFDSGLGGLTVLSAVQQLLPHESTVYLGDTARCPYGPRPHDEVRGFAVQIARFLAKAHRLKLLVVACNTASAVALPAIQAAVPHVPVLGVIEPGARAALQTTRSGRIGVMATIGTVSSHAYRRTIMSLQGSAQPVEQACPRLVPLVEAGYTNTPEVAFWLRTYLAPLREAQVDTIILGCTHYPLMRPLIDRLTAAWGISIVDSAYTTAVQARAILVSHEAEPGSARHIVYTTGRADDFEQRANSAFGHVVRGVVAVDLEADGANDDEEAIGYDAGRARFGAESFRSIGSHHGGARVIGRIASHEARARD